jgi:hypothetical protein
MSPMLDPVKRGMASVGAAFSAEVEKGSAVRKGSVRQLMAGELGVFDFTGSVIISYGNGSKVYNPGRDGMNRAICNTFIIQAKTSVSYEELSSRHFTAFDKAKERLIRTLIRLEENEVARRLWNANEIIRAPSTEVKRLRKFFADMGKEVAVLPTGKILELDQINLVVRTSPSVKIIDNPSYLRTDIIAWEDIGFVYELDEDEDLFYARER